ncbi:hypothetical protein ADUPG1_013050 [Aduncisulcus paluster]|uniref:Piwi domain-containing protein n=1 Tax=Aduncisulcus paluster TaxID=2918883 RepID=A0ABQ5K3C8_9EUKA|nr:hypothetical protein ADUPG1_013050 [Aduncisulcus paluster]
MSYRGGSRGPRFAPPDAELVSNVFPVNFEFEHIFRYALDVKLTRGGAPIRFISRGLKFAAIAKALEVNAELPPSHKFILDTTGIYTCVDLDVDPNDKWEGELPAREGSEAVAYLIVITAVKRFKPSMATSSEEKEELAGLINRIFNFAMRFSPHERSRDRFMFKTLDRSSMDGRVGARCERAFRDATIKRGFEGVFSITSEGVCTFTYEIKHRVERNGTVGDLLRRHDRGIQDEIRSGGLSVNLMYDPQRSHMIDGVDLRSIDDKMSADTDKTFRQYYIEKWSRPTAARRFGEAEIKHYKDIIHGYREGEQVHMLKSVGRDGGEIFFIADYCHYSGLTTEIRAALPEICGLKARPLLTEIENFSRVLTQVKEDPNFNPTRLNPVQVMKEWGVNIDITAPRSFAGQNLITPQVSVAGAGTVPVHELQRQLRPAHVSGCNIGKVFICYTQRADRFFFKVKRDIERQLGDWGVHHKGIQEVKIDDRNPVGAISGVVPDPHIAVRERHVFIVLISEQHHVYKQLKSVFFKFGIVSQFCQDSATGRRWNPIIASNVVENVVAKLGFTPWQTVPIVPACFSGPTLIVGVDVCHSKVQKSRSASGAMVTKMRSVAGMGAYFVNGGSIKYFGRSIDSDERRERVRAGSGAEVVSRAEETSSRAAVRLVAREQLAEFVFDVCRSTKCTPKDIVIVRGGVGEVLNDIVKTEELKPLKEKVAGFPGGDSVNITFVTARDGIRTRMVARAGRDSFDVSAGKFITDSALVAANEFLLFALQKSPSAPKPIKYSILCNDGRYNMQAIAQLCYNLCYMYYSWSSSVKVPAPVQYAHAMCNLLSDKFEHKALGAEKGPDDCRVVSGLHEGLIYI